MNTNEDKKEFLSISEFAEVLGKSPSTIRRAIESQRIMAIRIGKGKKASYSIPRSEIDRIGIVDLEDMINRLIEKKLKERENGRNMDTSSNNLSI